jgi:arsenate reductase-like glutaredoxin family protein
MLKRAQVYFRDPCPGAEETKSFLEEHGVLVIERDISKKPFTRKELGIILGYHNPKHYLDTDSSVFKKKKLDKKIPSRDELLDLILENQELLRNPIVLSGRLMAIGTNRQQMIDMFQIKVSGNGSDRDEGESSRRKK